PSSSTALIENVENYLSNMGYSYENKMVAKWMADENDKINLDGIEKLDAEPAFLLIKQAIATGWDSPRSQILVKLRENMSEDFEIQTIGRIRRMPEAKHYDNEILDCCYLYTFDEKYKEGILDRVGSAYEVTKLFLKNKPRLFSLPKENRDLDYDMVGLADVYSILLNYFKEKYKLTDDLEDNELKLQTAGYDLDDTIKGRYSSGRFITFQQVLDEAGEDSKNINYEVNTHIHGLDLMHSIDKVKQTLKMSHDNVRILLTKLLSKQYPGKANTKILNLNKNQWYAFIINNSKLLRDDFKELLSGESYQMKIVDINPKISTVEIPKEDFFRFDENAKNVDDYLSNAYKYYNKSMTVSGLRSTSERLLENYCEDNLKVEWVYKNGDVGQNYLSIVYLDRFDQQWLFYPDYIVKLKDESIWVIETKGGEHEGKSKNIDIRSEMKFKAFENYAKKNELNWGFVRDIDENLYLNNTIYTEDMSNDNWVSLERFF